ARRAPVLDLLPQGLLLGLRGGVAALDAAAHPRRSDDDHVLEVPRAARLREPPRHGGVDGRLPARRARRAAAPLRRGGGAPGPVPPARALPSHARRPEARGVELQHPRHRTHPGARLMGLGAYLRNIKDAALTIADGMAVTASHLVRKPYTVQYPDRLPEGRSEERRVGKATSTRRPQGAR